MLNARFIRISLSSVLLLICCSAHAQWQVLFSTSTNDLEEIKFVDPQLGYAVGSMGTVLRTTDAGASWQSLTTPSGNKLNTVHFHDANHGFTGGEDGLFETTDGGTTWTPIALDSTASINKIEFINAQVGFCGGQNGYIYKTIDGGTQWTMVLVNHPNTPNNFVSDFSFPSSDTGYACLSGYNWEYYRTIDGGDTWQEIHMGTPLGLTNFEGIHFTSNETGFMAGWYIGAFVATNNGGTSWSEQTNDLYNLWDVEFADENNGLAVGLGGIVIQTFDAGNSWVEDTVHSSSMTWNSIAYAPGGAAYICGYGGLIYKLDQALSISETAASAFEVTLSPNPTHGEFAVNWITPAESANIIISDLSGRQISTQTCQQCIQAQATLPEESGIYLVTVVMSDGRVATQRVVKP